MKDDKKFSWENLLSQREIKEGYKTIRELMADCYVTIFGMLVLSLEEDETFALEQYKQMRKYLSQRKKHTLGKIEFPLFTLIHHANLSNWQVFHLLLGSFAMYSPKSASVLKAIPENAGQLHPTKSLAIYLYQKFETLLEEDYAQYLDQTLFFDLFFNMSFEKESNLNGFGAIFCVKEEVFLYLMGSKNIPWKYQTLCNYINYRSENIEKNILIYQKEEMVMEQMLKDPLLKNITICLKAEEGSGKRFLISQAASSIGKGVIFVNYDDLELDNQLEIIKGLSVECILKNSLFCLVHYKEQDNEKHKLIHMIAKYHSVFFITSKQSVLKSITPIVRAVELVLKPPKVREKIILWNYFLNQYGALNQINSEYLASRYVVNAGDICNVLETASIYKNNDFGNNFSLKEIKDALKKYRTTRLTGFAEEIPVCFDWNDLVVEEEIKQQLQHICSRINLKNFVENTWGFAEKNPYRKGVCALFYGSPGTGKTMAVQIMAGEMGLDLYRIDLSRMVSKYIGETAKHISKLFEMAKEMNALLFFDEADAFFSKRTQVSDSMDRHANGDVAILLQKLEEYDGFSVLATNLKDNIDNAFKRRIQYMIHFQLPDEKARVTLWKKQFPKEVEMDNDIELEFFAKKFELSGSEINNVVVTSAYLAAEQQKPIANEHIIKALILNYAKYGRVLNSDDFGDLGR